MRIRGSYRDMTFSSSSLILDVMQRLDRQSSRQVRGEAEGGDQFRVCSTLHCRSLVANTVLHMLFDFRLSRRSLPRLLS